MSEDKENIEQEKTDKKLSLKRIIILILISFVIISLIIISIANYQKPDLKTQSLKGLFKYAIKSSKFYSVGGGIFDLGDDKYILLGGTNKIGHKYNTVPKIEKKIHYEIFDNKTKKIIETSDDILYNVSGSVQLDNGNLFIINGTNKYNNNRQDVELSIFDIKTKEIKSLKLTKELFQKPEIIRLVKLPNNRVLILNTHYNNKDIPYIFDANSNKFFKAPCFAKKFDSDLYGIALKKDSYIIIGSRHPKTKNIEVCNIRGNKCVIAKSILSYKNIMGIFKTKENKVIIARQSQGEDTDIELFDPENDTIEIIGRIPRDKVIYRKFTQLKNGNLLITGGIVGIWAQSAVNDAYIFDVNKKELIKLYQNMKFERDNHQQTKVLNNGNVLICGGSAYNYCEIFVINK